MLDDHAGRVRKLPYALERRVGIHDVVIREFLALQLPRAAHRDAACAGVCVKCRLLVRIFAVTQVHALAKRQVEVIAGRLCAFLYPGQVSGDRGIVLCRMGKCLGGQALTKIRARMAGVGGELRQECGIIRRIHDHSDRGVVLGRRAQHGGSADIDVLDRILIAAVAAGNRRGKGVEVHDQKVDRRDAVLLHDGLVQPAPAEQAAMDARMQRLDPPVHDLGKAGVVTDFPYRDAFLRKQLGCATGGKEFYVARLQSAGNVDYASLV